MKKAIFAAGLMSAALLQAADPRPNIVIILTDDSGYSDLGCYGSEIDTPNLDQMAADGLRFRNFYNNGRCSPSRASLMTGRDSAHAGFAAGTLGGWSREMQQPAYRARLPYDLPTIAEVMKASGYRTMMTGKWHLGGSLLKNFPQWQGWWEQTHPGWVFSEEEAEADFNALPPQRGFDEFFGMIEGETHHFFTPDDSPDYFEGNQRAVLSFDRTYDMFCYYNQTNRYPYTANHGRSGPAFYATDGMTDRALEMIRNASGADQPPFFMYVAYRAPHTPLQAPKELVDKYLSRYADLPAVEAGRVDGLVREGLWEAGTPYRKFFVPARDLTTGRMKELHVKAAVHAAMVEKVDENVGKIFQTLEKTGQLDNTLVIYLSDNGSASHLGDLMNTPYYGCKALMWEGGTKTHCIARWPGVIAPGTITESIGWIGDLLPTCLEVAGGSYPSGFRGTKTAPLDGRSLLPVLKGEAMDPPEYLFSNDKGQQGVIYKGRWKLLIEPGWYVNTQKEPGAAYELYDLQTDPAEKNNMAEQKPELVKQLVKACEDWQQRCGIVDYGEILKIRPDHTK
jgi:arylsulfatase